MAKVTLRQLSLVQLQRELARRQSALPRLQKKRARLLSALKKVEEAITELGGAVAPRTTKGRRPRPTRKMQRVRNKMSLGDALARVLQDAKSMKIADLVAGVKRLGYKSKAKDFRLIVNQVLVKDKRFRSVRRGRYALSKAGRAAPAKKGTKKS